MTHEKNITSLAPAQELELTPEEQNWIQANHPTFFESKKAWENGESNYAIYHLLAIVRKMRNRDTIENDAKLIADATHAVVAEKMTNPKQGNLLTLLGYLPADMAKISPFFPLKPNAERKYLENYEFSTGEWGKLLYTGPQLSVSDEDVLLILLGVLKKAEAEKYLTTIITDGKTTYKYSGPARPFLQALRYNRPCKKDYERFFLACKRLMGAIVEIEISAGKTKSGRKRTPIKNSAHNMLIRAEWVRAKKEFELVLNPYFYELFLSNQLLTIDLTTRMEITGAIAKALYRFVICHKKLDGKIPFKESTLVSVTNMDANQIGKKKKSSLKKAILELIRVGILDEKSGYCDDNHIRLIRKSKKMSLPPNQLNTRLSEK